VQRLIAKHGPDMKLPDLRAILANLSEGALVQHLRPTQGEVRGLQLSGLTDGMIRIAITTAAFDARLSRAADRSGY
jgi:hypothetical protein